MKCFRSKEYTYTYSDIVTNLSFVLNNFIRIQRVDFASHHLKTTGKEHDKTFPIFFTENQL